MAFYLFPTVAPPVPACQNLGMQFIPRNDRVVLEVIEEPQTTASGIYIPDSAEGKPSRGTIVHAGDVASLAAGDVVLFGNYSGTEISDGKRALLIISQRDIWAKIEENEDELE